MRCQQFDRDVAVQVSSPGIDRTFKSNDEFAVFAGRGVTILRRDADKWTGGIVDSADDAGVTIRTESGLSTIAFGEIQKARLDYSQEVR